MGKKGSNKTALNVSSRPHSSITLREEARGKRQTSVNGKSMLKLEHVRKLAVWASGEVSIPSLGAFFGHRLATLEEALRSSPDPSLFRCQRCESILQPGHNCSVQTENKAAKVRHRHKRPDVSIQNRVAYKCHYCSHQNWKTIRGKNKEVRPPKAKLSLQLEPSCPVVNSEKGATGPLCPVTKSVNLEQGTTANLEVETKDEMASPAITTHDPVADSPATPSIKTAMTLLEAKRRKRNRSGSKKAAKSQSESAAVEADKSVSTSNKRKRKSWTSLKELAERSEHGNGQNLMNLTVPFLI